MPTIVIVIIIGIRLVRTDNIPVIAITIIAIRQNNGRSEGHRQRNECRCVKKFCESHGSFLPQLRSFAARSLWDPSEQLSCPRDFPYPGHKDIEVVSVSLSSLQPHTKHKEKMCDNLRLKGEPFCGKTRRARTRRETLEAGLGHISEIADTGTV